VCLVFWLRPEDITVTQTQSRGRYRRLEQRSGQSCHRRRCPTRRCGRLQAGLQHHYCLSPPDVPASRCTLYQAHDITDTAGCSGQHCAAVPIGRIMGLPVRPSVLYGLPTQKQKQHRKVNSDVNVSVPQQRWPLCQFPVQEVKGQAQLTSRTSRKWRTLHANVYLLFVARAHSKLTASRYTRHSASNVKSGLSTKIM